MDDRTPSEKSGNQMSSRQRFHETMRYGKPDRVPYFEEGIRKEVLEYWYRQGLSRRGKLSELFNIDKSYELDLDFNPFAKLGAAPKTIGEIRSLRDNFNPKGINSFWRMRQRLTRSWNKKDHVLFLRVHDGFFLTMGVYDWRRFAEVISLLLDDPEFVREVMTVHGELTAYFLDAVLNDIQVDAVIFSEPIGGNEGPLISPAMYDEFVLKSYMPILDIIRKHAIDTVVLRTYANIRILIPNILNYGFNCLWACETNSAAMDYRAIRSEFGRDLRLIGGIDLDALRNDKETIRREIEEKVPSLIASGGYVPIADGRIREDIPFENYLYYRRLLEGIIG